MAAYLSENLRIHSNYISISEFGETGHLYQVPSEGSNYIKCQGSNLKNDLSNAKNVNITRWAIVRISNELLY